MKQDKLLIEQMKRGDTDALRIVYEKYKDTLLTLAVSMMKDLPTAEDILHDVFVRFASVVPKLELKTSLKSYLATCVVNNIRDRIRKEQSQKKHIGCSQPIPEVQDSPEYSVILDEHSQQVTEALAKLTIEQREVISLRLNGGFKFKEIARIKEITVEAVQSRYRYGLDKLRRMLIGGAEQ